MVELSVDHLEWNWVAESVVLLVAHLGGLLVGGSVELSAALLVLSWVDGLGIGLDELSVALLVVA